MRTTALMLWAVCWAGAIPAPAAGQDAAERKRELLAMLRAAEGTGDAAAIAVATLRALPRDALQPAIPQMQKAQARARQDVLKARADRAKQRARTVVTKFAKQVARLRKELKALIRGYQKPQQPQVDALRKELETIVYRKVPEKDLVSGTFRRAHLRYDLYDELLLRAGARVPSRSVLAKAIGVATREALLKAWMKGSHARAFDALERYRKFLQVEEYHCIKAVNRYRALLGLRPHLVNPKLVICARKHSEEMVRLGYFSHTSPVAGRRSYTQRASLEGTSAATENIAAGHAYGEGAFEGWYHSPGHHKNIIGGQSKTGVGKHGTTWTQMFG